MYQVVVIYDDPRGGTWRGPVEDRQQAEARLLQERERVRGRVFIEYVGAHQPYGRT